MPGIARRIRRMARSVRTRCSYPCLLPALLLGVGVKAETPASLVRLPEPAGLGRLVQPDGRLSPPLVVLLPDALGDDVRSDPYVGSLVARGIATLTLGLGEDRESPDQPVDPAASPAALPAAVAWARAAGFARIGVMGFGLGGRAALAGAGTLPAAALYPGCKALPATVGRALVLQGADAATGCGEIIASEGMRLHLLPGAGHAWDAPGAIWPSPGPLFPNPAGGGWLRGRADHTVTLRAAEMLTEWFGQALAAPGSEGAMLARAEDAP